MHNHARYRNTLHDRSPLEQTCLEYNLKGWSDLSPEWLSSSRARGARPRQVLSWRLSCSQGCNMNLCGGGKSRFLLQILQVYWRKDTTKLSNWLIRGAITTDTGSKSLHKVVPCVYDYVSMYYQRLERGRALAAAIFHPLHSRGTGQIGMV